ncbi:TonB-linked outer membrane protein, SusC/RagA family [Parapedobacter composti]|uniref:TonB-linked outer membrane protein, SusC/RagA family n=1 Tax=Parapedobacter composti TaxID=623281 RepID=A0A1I1FWP5_9SPHI|nr:SusC/RagA family TonB-linked outer membrane protein [Parapedobacter composti]SFC03701.1 TonB-linked outer membrane protein, SusC/RagA family [Parapedobacter composti]
MKTYISLIFCFTALQAAFSQTYTVAGRVVAEQDSTPIPNASVYAAQQETSVRTDASGSFQLRLQGKGATLKVSHIGHLSREVSVTFPQQQPLVITLPVAMHQLDEAVVSTGYETLSKERATGSFEKIDNALLNRSVSMDVLSRIENLATGIHFEKGDANFNTAGRRPNHDIYIHGISTLNAGTLGGNAPLIVLDNFPYEGDINSINPNDIESVTVLKDAAAASIWGAKAGNGVIVLTSKKATYEQPVRVSVTSNINVIEKPDLYQHRIISTSDYIDVEQLLFQQGFYNNKENSRAKPALSPVVEILIKQRDGLLSATEAQQAIDAYRQNDVRNDMLRYMYREGLQQQHSLQISSGTNRQKLIIGGGYDQSLPSRVGSQNSRITLRAENNLKPTRNLELALGVRWAANRYQEASAAETYQNSGYPFPYIALADENGRPIPVPKDYRMGFLDTAGNGRLLDWHYRPLDEIKNPPTLVSSEELLLNLGLNYKLLPWLDLDVKYQFSQFGTKNETHHNIDSYYARNRINRGSAISEAGVKYHFPFGGILNTSRQTSSGHRFRGQFNLNKQWLDASHQLHAILGAEVQESNNRGDGFIAYGYNDELLTYAGQIDFTYWYPVYGNLASSESMPFAVMDFTETTNRFVSFFSNASYSYRDRYTASFSARRDASNLFGVNTNDKWTPLWSAGLSWSVHREPFFTAQWLPRLKIRATYGYSGNVDNSMSALTTINYSNQSSTGVDLPGAGLRNPPNPSLRWEKVRNTNLGVDFAISGNRMRGSVDYYWKHTEDLLHFYPIDPTVGVTSMTMNVANTKSRGLNVNINTQNLSGKLAWATHWLFSYNNNWITHSFVEYTGPTTYVRGRGMSQIPGTLAFPIYSYRWAGLNPETGEPMGYLGGDVSQDYRSITSANTKLEDLVFHGSTRPLYFGSLRNDFSFRGFSLSVNISGYFGYYFRRRGMDYAQLINNGDGHIDYYARWQKPGDEKTTHVPAFQYPISAGNSFYQNTEPLVEKGDHIRLQDCRFAYTLPSMGSWLKSGQVYLYANNLGIIWRANKLRLDPQVNGNIPMPANFAMGVNLNF